MCGIAGYIINTDESASMRDKLLSATNCLQSRGPDSSGIYQDRNVGLGHRRLSIIDLSQEAAQPMSDVEDRYTLCFNGEIYNYLQLREDLIKNGTQFRSSSDTEVLLQLFMQKGIDCVELLNGFFAFAIYDKVERKLFLVRDRFGIKPLFYYHHNDQIFFSSEIKALVEFKIPKEIDKAALATYLQLNYIPGPHSIFQNVKKVEPGKYLEINTENFEGSSVQVPYYNISSTPSENINNTEAEDKLFGLLDDAVKKRLVSDVPLGSFLSGGIDSSIIAALASQHVDKLKTFSIGYKDEPHFDETKYAELVAKKIGSEHHVFKLSNDDLFEILHDVLDYMSEPFADSSALAVYILSSNVRQHVTVALSGDGADELFAGYNKHRAHYKALNDKTFTNLVKVGSPFWKLAPKSRQNKISNIFR
ncbi:MAG: asparagine synthase (glutamine-hydrolyzing), partial [Bacteroidia bacterium]|nr:asparagine synthase (glutamine-hydrolyzing) [Bacteroidia bacterium]